jgi:glycosyltransferase involved in cell wall biosynthesis
VTSAVTTPLLAGTSAIEAKHQVVLVLDGLYVAGAQRHCLELLKVFGRRGMSRVVIALEGGGRWADRFLAESEHLLVGDGTPFGWSQVQDLIPGVSPAIVSAHLMCAVEWAASNLADAPSRFAHLHCEPSEHEPVTAAWMHRELPRFHSILVPARSTLGALTSLLPANDSLREKFRVLPNSVQAEEEVPAPTDPQSRELRIGAVSRIDNDKFSVPVFLGACDSLDEQGVDFEIQVAGEGELLSELKETIGRRSWAQRIRFRGFVDDVSAIYNWADVVFIPSKRESAPYVLLEALALRRPIVGPATGVLTELGDIERVFLYPPGDGRAAAAAILKAQMPTMALGDRGTTDRLPSMAVPEYPDWERMVWEVYGR